MRKFIYILAFVVGFSEPLIAQEIPALGSAYAIAMGGSGINPTNIWSITQNVAIQPSYSGLFIGSNYARGYIQEQGRYNLIGGFTGHKFTLSSFYQYYGFSEYHSQSAALNYSQQLSQKFSAGVSLRYHLASMPKLNKQKSLLSYHLAIYYQLSSTFAAGVQFQQPALGIFDGSAILKKDQGFRFSLCYQQQDKAFNLQSHAVYLSEFEQLRLQIGVDLRVHEQWRIQTGTSTHPFTPGFGFTWHALPINLAFSSGYHPQLGFLPSVSIAYASK